MSKKNRSNDTQSEIRLENTTDTSPTVPTPTPPSASEITTGQNKTMGIIAIVAGLLIIVSGYIVYKYFSDAQLGPKQNIADVQIEEQNQNANQDTETDFSGITTTPQGTFEPDLTPQPGDSTGIVAGANTTAPSQTSQIKETLRTQTNLVASWKANNYTAGDIKIGQYTVIWGDTLWEISEGAYGSGRKWPTIADTNRVRYLSNGNPLITPGETLTIPSI